MVFNYPILFVQPLYGVPSKHWDNQWVCDQEEANKLASQGYRPSYICAKINKKRPGRFPQFEEPNDFSRRSR